MTTSDQSSNSGQIESVATRNPFNKIEFLLNFLVFQTAARAPGQATGNNQHLFAAIGGIVYVTVVAGVYAYKQRMFTLPVVAVRHIMATAALMVMVLIARFLY